MTTIATLCAGGELFGVGSGLKHLWGVEFNPAIAAVAELNGFASIVARVQDVDYSSLQAPYWLHMSPPCTNASNANTKGGETELDIEIAEGCIRAIRTLRPPVVSLENVLPYRKFEAFKMICGALREEGYLVEWWSLLAADYGVPQTRRRLFLVASCVRKPQRPTQTHEKRGKATGQLSLFDPPLPWVGWYEAIEDLVDALPEDEFAPWQVERLPAGLRETMLIGLQGHDGGITRVSSNTPAFTITANDKQAPIRAFIVRGDNTGQQRGKGYRGDIEPSQTVGANGAAPRAFLLMTGNTQIAKPTGTGIKQPDEPANTITVASVHARAFLVPGGNGSNNTLLAADEPAMSVSGPKSTLTARACAGGRVVRMTPRCLARFQSIPDSYRLPDSPGLACMIIGNAVPPKMAKVLVAANLPRT